MAICRGEAICQRLGVGTNLNKSNGSTLSPPDLRTCRRCLTPALLISQPGAILSGSSCWVGITYQQMFDFMGSDRMIQ